MLFSLKSRQRSGVAMKNQEPSTEPSLSEELGNYLSSDKENPILFWLSSMLTCPVNSDALKACVALLLNGCIFIRVWVCVYYLPRKCPLCHAHICTQPETTGEPSTELPFVCYLANGQIQSRTLQQRLFVFPCGVCCFWCGSVWICVCVCVRSPTAS